MALVGCRECGKQVSDQAKECPECGAADPASASGGIACPECGAGISEEDETCPECGLPDPAEAAHSQRLRSLQTSGASKDKSSSDSGFRRSGEVVVENPENGYRKTLSRPGIKVFFTGSLYFLRHGMWSQAVFGFFVGVLTIGFGWLYLGWKAEDYIKDHYRSKGWRVVRG